MQLRDTKEEILECISALASSERDDSASWVLFALEQAPGYGRQHIVDVSIVCLMNALRMDQGKGDRRVTGILTELWDALFCKRETIVPVRFSS